LQDVVSINNSFIYFLFFKYRFDPGLLKSHVFKHGILNSLKFVFLSYYCCSNFTTTAKDDIKYQLK